MQDRTLALAAAFQCAGLVTSIARTGQFDQRAAESSLSSVYFLNADTNEEVFGGAAGVSLGLKILREQLSGSKRDMELLRYLIAMSALQNRLRRHPAVVRDLRDRIRQCSRQATMFEPDHAGRISRLADIYENTLSTIDPRILVRGRTEHLEQPRNVELIRALLLAGVRACVAWHQAGGRRRQLIFQRAGILTDISSVS